MEKQEKLIFEYLQIGFWYTALKTVKLRNLFFCFSQRLLYKRSCILPIYLFKLCSLIECYTMKSDLLGSSGIHGRQADRHQFQACLVIFGIKGDDEDDDTDANPTEGDD